MTELLERGHMRNIEPSDDGSVAKQALPGEYQMLGDYVIQMASMADDMPAWGTYPAARDIKLREFWPTEPLIASAIYTTVARYAAFGWQLLGPKRLVNIYELLLHSSAYGKGWIRFITPVLIDLFTQDNGAFIEIIRERDDALSPVVNLNHLDAGRCIRTGRLKEPVIFMDRWGVPHTLKWYQVITLEEMPSPIERMRGMQYCVLTRMLRAAQIMRDISIYKREKISGRNPKSVWLVGGVQTKTIRDAMSQHSQEADSSGLLRYVMPAIIGSLDPTATVSATEVKLAGLPEDYDESQALHDYIVQLAMAFGTDFQEFAPLMSRGAGGAGGSSASSNTISLKARGKGPKLFMSMLEHAFNWHGVFPNNVVFKYGDQDASESLDAVKLNSMRAEERAIRIKSGEISPEVARQIAVDAGDLDEKYLAELKNYVPAEVKLAQDQAKTAAKVAAQRASDQGQGRSGVKEPRASQDDGAANHVV